MSTRSRLGAVNAHTHLYSGLVPFGMPPPPVTPQNFVQMLERVWWRLDRALDEPSLRAAARYYVWQARVAGTTGLIDHHESPELIEGSLDMVADACEELGVRAVLCYGASERNGGREEGRRGLQECRRFIRDNRRPGVRGAVGLHASFTVSDATIRQAGELCRELGTVLHAHVAEDLADVEDARRRGYADPLDRLLQLHALPPGSVLAHCVHLDAQRIREAATRGVWIVQNARSNHSNRVGYPIALGESSLVALGTDGFPADMDAEQEALLEQARRHGEDMAAASKRKERSRDLLDELFATIRQPEAADRTESKRDEQEPDWARFDHEALVAEAQREAARLWERMRALAD